MKVGVLALQGAFEEHGEVLRSLGCDAIEVRLPQDLAAIDAVILPGGESTTVSKLLEWSGLALPLGGLIASGMPAFGTCAGMILLAQRIDGAASGQHSLGAIDICVRRNAFGRQVRSFETDLDVAGVEGGTFRAIFIRAPAIVEAGPGVELIAEVNGQGVAAREGRILVTAFHPELSGDARVHEYFLELASEA